MHLEECLKESSQKTCKVTLVTWQISGGGIEKILTDYLKYLKNEIDFTVYSLRTLRKSDYKDILSSGNTVNLCSGHNRNLILYRKFLFYALRNKNHVFHLFNAGPVILLILRLAKVKMIIYHIHGTIYWQSPWEKKMREIPWHLALYRSNHLHNMHFLANSEFSKKRFLEQISSCVNINVLYNPFDINRFTPVTPVTPVIPVIPVIPLENRIIPGQAKKKAKKIVYVGRLVKGKNLFLWLDVAKYILNYFPQTTFTIVGDGNLKAELTGKIKTMGLENHIEITGHINDIEKVYQAHDLLLFLSEYESFGNVVVESVLTQTPVIASAIPSLKEIFINYPEFLVPLDNHIFEAIIDRLNRYDTLIESVIRARNDFIQTFNLEKHIKRVKILYQNTEKETWREK